MHVCKVNNKVYVGITRQKLSQRFRNGKGYLNNEYFNNAIQKYGWDKGFEHIVLFKNKNKEEAEKLEILFINILLSNNRTYGYNIESGGNSTGKMAKKSKKKISKANLGRIVSDEVKLKIGKALKGKYVGINSHKYGKVVNNKKIICYDKIFNSIQECAIFYNEHHANISQWLRGMRTMPDKFKELNLSFYDIEENNKKEENIKEKIKNNKKSKKIICDNRIFKSITECSKYYNIKRSTMAMWLLGENRMPQKFIELELRYYNEEIDGDYEQYKLVKLN